ncbi:HMG domain-containing 3 isoform X2 [Labeo rohita]|uniref:HMG domain-containing 3 isoform X2 n=1 Tax=Labeo rohita TaxID=84645 RepID=A0A498MHE9_LABRO|nr:HMG domain-containing 3 isoform X2 [Labeo rohita]
MVEYILQKKKIPAVLPDNIRVTSPGKEYPKYLFPDEASCQRCPGVVPLSDPILITKRAKILTSWGIIEDVSTYCKQCPLCGIFYRYQEWKDQLHNFNDYNIVDIPLCLTLRSLLQVHTAVSRTVEALEDTTGVKFPSGDTVLHAYLHFEALTDHDYKFSCVTCGDHPPVVIMDLHKKGVFHLSVSDIQGPVENYNGNVNLEEFWESLSSDMIGRGFVASGRHNPFAVSPTNEFWAPWIGKRTRCSNFVLNTEFEKIHVSKSVSEISEITVTEDRLREELFKQKVEVVRKLCRECGLDSHGSRSDLLLRLSNEMKSRQAYDKIFEKIWGASGGWAVIMCPCGIVYSIKCNLRAESPRDFADLLLSWKHMPNVIIYDFARGLATHMNLRESEKVPISPFEGRLAEPSQLNIELAKSGKLKVSLPWLNTKKAVPDINGHPVTGSSHHYNVKKNNKVLHRLRKTFGSMLATNMYGQAVLGNPCLSPEEPGGTDVVMEDSTQTPTMVTSSGECFGFFKFDNVVYNAPFVPLFRNPCFSPEEPGGNQVMMEDSTPTATKVTTSGTCDIKHLSASRSCWDFQPSDRQSAMLNWTLSKNDPDETIAQVGNIRLHRKDFWTLGLNAELEATIANACLEVIVMVAKEKGMDVLAVDSYVVFTWLPPLDLDPFPSFPVLKPKSNIMHFLDSNNPYGTGDAQYVIVFSKLTSRIAPGQWKLIKNKNVPQQLSCSVDCGVFMLMYALYTVFEAPFDFRATINKVKIICHRQHALVDVQGPTDEDLKNSDMETGITKDLHMAVQWLRVNQHLFRGSVEEPWYLTLTDEDQKKALLQLSQAETNDEIQLAKEPFMFHFECKDDMDIFLNECRVKTCLRVNCMYKEF